MGLISTTIYTSELILCFIICVHSATRHNIHMYPYSVVKVYSRKHKIVNPPSRDIAHQSCKSVLDLFSTIITLGL